MNKILYLCGVAFLSFYSYGQQTEKSIQSYFSTALSLNPIEGIWKVEITREFYHYDTLYDVQHFADSQKVAILNANDQFTAYLVNGESYDIEFSTTDVKGVYMYQNFYPLMSEYSKKQAVICMRGKMEYTYDLPEKYVAKICGEKSQHNTRVVNILSWNKISPENK